MVLDLNTGACSGLPEGVTIDGVTPSSDGSTVMVKLLSPSSRAQFGQTFSQTYRDPEGGEHTFTHWGAGKEFDEDDREIGTYELIYFDYYPWDTAEVELSYTSVSEYDPEVRVELGDSKLAGASVCHAGWALSHLEADPPHGLDAVPGPGIPELLAQIAHVGLEGALGAVGGVRGDLPQQPGLGDHLGPGR